MTGNESELERRLSLSVEEGIQAASALPSAAAAVSVNRTHRLVRERARSLQARRSTLRSLLLPLTVCSGLVLVFCIAVWTVLEQYALEPNGLSESSRQMVILLMWCLPLSAILLAVVWLRKAGGRSENETRP